MIPFFFYEINGTRMPIPTTPTYHINRSNLKKCTTLPETEETPEKEKDRNR
jgi:hypothetical protein